MLAHAVTRQAKNGNGSHSAPTASIQQQHRHPAVSTTPHQGQHKTPFNAGSHNPTTPGEGAGTGSAPDPPPYLSSISNVAGSLHKSDPGVPRVGVQVQSTIRADGLRIPEYTRQSGRALPPQVSDSPKQAEIRTSSSVAQESHDQHSHCRHSHFPPSPAATVPHNLARLSGVQNSAKVSAPGDSSELEARAIAREVMDTTAVAIPSTRGSGKGSRRNAASVSMHEHGQEIALDEEERGGGKGGSRFGEPEGRISHNTLQMPGSIDAGVPLTGTALEFMESRFSTGLGHVRIHTGENSERLARRLSARAFTVGSHIFFGRGQFQPYSHAGQELLAHEITHTFQQGGTVRRSEEEGEEDRGGLIGEALDFIAEKANLIPGFRMFTIILGVNPVNMSSIERSPGNIMRALIEFIPGGALITQALDNHGIFDKVSDWVGQQVDTLGMVGSSIKHALMSFLDSLSWDDLLDPWDAWERAKSIFTEPIDRIIEFAKGLVTDIVKFIKDAILMPIAELAQGTPGWDLLIAVLGENPITGEEVARDANTLIGGFMKLIGKEDVWENMQKANAVGRAWAWFQGAMAALIGFVQQIPTMVINAFESLTLEDIILVPNAFIKVGAVFANFIGDFISWAGEAVWNLLEIIFDVVSPGALSYIKRTGAALRSILENPLPFVGNLVKAAKQGFQNFGSHFVEHLKAGMINWLTGSLPGVYIPQAFSLGEIVKFVFSVLGLSWQNVRQKLVKVVGEPAVKAMETGFDIVVTLVTQGPAAAWDKIKEQLSNLKDMVISGIIDLVVDAVVKKAIPKLIAMFIPGAGFISAIISIYDTVMVFVNKLSKIAEVVTGFINSIVAIASGDIGGAASRVESILAGILSLAINFLAGFAGLGKIADKIMGVINKVRVHVDKGLDALIGWIVKMAKTMFAKAFGKEDEDKKNTKKPAAENKEEGASGLVDERTAEQKKIDVENAISDSEKLLSDASISAKELEEALPTIKTKYRLKSLNIVVDETTDEGQLLHVHAEINPKGDSKKTLKKADGKETVQIDSFGSRPAWRPSTKDELSVQKGEDRRHIDAWQVLHERLKMSLNGKPFKKAAEILKRIGTIGRMRKGPYVASEMTNE
ncbi:MAG TPA: DUF4157 domain-containing protein, partial [Nitrososphaera sp.]|nr:DUF4157 domain-containing protein [Nitrososphaera sp.]